MTTKECGCREAMFERAVAIADEAMVGLLMAHCLRADEDGARWALVDEQGARVSTLAEADPAVIEAVRWLRERMLCELIENHNGAIVALRTRQCCTLNDC